MIISSKYSSLFALFLTLFCFFTISNCQKVDSLNKVVAGRQITGGYCSRQRPTFEGCICYLGQIDVFKRSGPLDGKAIAWCLTCRELPGVCTEELRRSCSRIYKEWELRSKLPLLRSINRYLKKCRGKTVKDFLVEGSEYAMYFMD